MKEEPMLIVQRGEVKHNGEHFTKNHVLPDMPPKEAKRLIKLGVVVDWNPQSAVLPEAHFQPKLATAADKMEGEPNTPGQVGEPIHINFNPDDAIKGTRRS
jgi:hypothetical protein